MPTPAYLTIQGTSQGLITAGALSKESVGNIHQSGHNDKILVQALSHGMYIPPEGSYRMHKPLVITKIIDKSSPLINSALVNAEHLEVCRLDFYRTAAEGVQEHYYTMELEEALIIAADVTMPHCNDPSKAYLGHMEEIHITYRKITWTHHIAGTESADQWRASKNT